jgi:hypothetical protein
MNVNVETSFDINGYFKPELVLKFKDHLMIREGDTLRVTYNNETEFMRVLGDVFERMKVLQRPPQEIEVTGSLEYENQDVQVPG